MWYRLVIIYLNISERLFCAMQMLEHLKFLAESVPKPPFEIEDEKKSGSEKRDIHVFLYASSLTISVHLISVYLNLT